MTDITVAQLAREGHGAIQVDLPAPGTEPVKVMLAGPIKHWWSLTDDQWGKGRHAEFIEWRDAVEVAFIKAGFLVYCPHKAWRGSWSEVAQAVNNAAIEAVDVVVDLTPYGIPNGGTLDELKYAAVVGTPVVHMPPSSAEALLRHVAALRSVRQQSLRRDGHDPRTP